MSINKNKLLLRLILGDQLNINHSWFSSVSPDITYVLMEIRTETDYALHHIQKVTGIFSAMRNFASEIKKLNHQVIYLKINDSDNLQSFEKNILHLIEHKNFTHFEYQLPDEYRVDEALKQLSKKLTLSHEVFDSEHFLSSREELGEFFKGKKLFLMESFYRYMRKKHRILMEGQEPYSGKWNYDSDNRKKLPASHQPTPPLVFDNDESEIVAEIKKAGIKTIGNIIYLWVAQLDAKSIGYKLDILCH